MNFSIIYKQAWVFQKRLIRREITNKLSKSELRHEQRKKKKDDPIEENSKQDVNKLKETDRIRERDNEPGETERAKRND